MGIVPPCGNYSFTVNPLVFEYFQTLAKGEEPTVDGWVKFLLSKEGS